MVKNGNWAIWLIRTTVLSLSFDTILYTPPPLLRDGVANSIDFEISDRSCPYFPIKTCRYAPLTTVYIS